MEFAIAGDIFDVFNGIIHNKLPSASQPPEQLPADRICPKLALCELMHGRKGGCSNWHPRWCEEVLALDSLKCSIMVLRTLSLHG